MTVKTGIAELLDHEDLTAAPDAEAGLGALGTERGNLPLETIDVRSVVTGLAVRTELSQGFRNPYEVPLEATYVFPLPDRAAVTALRMEAEDRVVEGVLKERGEARVDYDRALAEGKRASIAEEERPGVFTMRVGNIMPGERIVVRTTLAGRLPYEDGEATYRFPLVVAPRYIPGAALPGGQVGDGTARDTDAVPDASRISPPVLLPGFPNPVRLSVEVEVDPVGLPLTAVRSSLHNVQVTALEGPDSGTRDAHADAAVGADGDRDGHARRVSVRLTPGDRADRDFILRLRFGSEDVVTTSLAVSLDDPDSEKGPDGDGTFMLTLLPPAIAAKQARPRDVVIVLDRSGSMDGWKMVAARRAAARVVDTLTAADRFTVLAFDDVVETAPGLPAGLVAATDRHRFRAVEHLAEMEARGGTEMDEPLSRAADLLAPGKDARDAVLVLVTDGQVGNEDQILARLAPRLTGVRVHTLGIDRAVNEAFLRRLADLNGGRYELVESEDRLDEAMEQIHRRIGSPQITGLRLLTGGLFVDPGTVTPSRLPDVFAGAPVVITGRFIGRGNLCRPTDSAEGLAADHAAGRTDSELTVAGTDVNGAGWQTKVPAIVVTDAALAPYWARGRIRDMEDRYVIGDDDLPALEKTIVATSLRYGVLCRFTSFVAVDSKVVNAGGGLRKVTQPVDAPSGWDMFDQSSDTETAKMRKSAPMRSRGASFGALGGMRPAGAPSVSAGPGGASVAWAAPAAEASVDEYAAIAGGGGGEMVVMPDMLKEPEPAQQPVPQPSPRPAPPSAYQAPVSPPPAPLTPPLPSPDSRVAAAEALSRLVPAAATAASDRIRLLASLPSLLAHLIDRMTAEGRDASAIASVAALKEKLEGPVLAEEDLDAWWEKTLSVLRLVAGEAPEAPEAAEASESQGRRHFWKRS